LQLAPELCSELSDSCLLIFKGDLHYRKLASDASWPPTTSFADALLGFGPAPLVSLRTLKADVIAGLAQGQAERLDAIDKRWQVNGRWAVLQFSAGTGKNAPSQTAK
jgi:damage-control phosphatase, subfamily III